MNRLRFSLVLVSLFAGLFVAHASNAQTKSWDFQRWDADITILPNSAIEVRETQVFDLTGDFSWVTRTLVKTKGIWYDQIEVTNADGSRLDASDVEIDDRRDDVLITVHFSKTPVDQMTQKTFVFRYRALNALGDFEDHDELYWNAVSNERAVPIHEASAIVHLPVPYEAGQLRLGLFVGPTGSTQESTNFQIVDGSTLKYFGSDIAANENLTLVAGWPKGAVQFTTFEQPKTNWQKAWTWLRWPYWLSPLLIIAWLFTKWWRGGRDPKGKGVIIAQYDPPDGAPPAVVGTLVDERVDTKDFSATLIDLAVRGFLRIEEEKSTGVFAKTTYRFIRTKAPSGDAQLKPFERETLQSLFGSDTVVTLDQLKNTFYKKLKEIKKLVYEETTQAGYFDGNPEIVRGKYMIAGFLFMFAGFFGLFPFLGWGAAFFLFGFFMPKKTVKGVAAKDWALGFKLYLHTAERFRVAAMTPETFERFLPYAMVFQVEKQWASRFADIAKTPPSWYSTNDPNFHFTSVLFASHLASVMSTSVGRALASSPSSGSGFGGGGFGGGGGGGGGSGAG